MKVDLSVPLLDVEGKNFKKENSDLNLLVKDIIINSLLGQTNEKIGGLDKYKCYLLYKRIEFSEESIIPLTVEEITAIKALVDKFYGPIIVGQVYSTLEGE